MAFYTHIFDMNEPLENTLSAYKGPEFQQRLMWQLLVEPEFAEKIIPNIAIEYFDDPYLKRLFIIILEYFKMYEKVPNFQNNSIHQAINEFKTPNNVIEEESLFAVIKKIGFWNERVINKQMHYDGDVVQKSTNEFIKQQEYRKLAESILDKVKNGDIRSKFVIAAIEEKFQKVSHIGEEEDNCSSVLDGIDKALRKEFRETIPTGIGTIDALTGGGLGKGEIGVILTPSGVGKTTALTIIADTAYQNEKNVAQIIFEDTEDQIKRKHYTIWAESALSRLNDEEENIRVKKIVHDKAKSLEGKGRLIIKRFSQENTTMLDVKNWMIGYQKKWGFKFDILVLDYLDCLESHKKSPDRNEAELAIIKAFEALSSDFDIPAWTAIQSNRSGFGSEFVEANQSGGSIKRIQKAHFFMSVGKTPAQQEANLANIRIIKARFAKDGQTFEDCVFNNDTMQVIIDDPRYRYTKTYKDLKHYDNADGLESQAEKLKEKSTEIRLHEAISRANIEDNPNISEAEKLNRLLRENSGFETPSEENARQLVEGMPETTRKHIEDIRTEIDNNIAKRITEGINEGANEGVNDGLNSDISKDKSFGIDVEAELTKVLEKEMQDPNYPAPDAVNDAVNDVVNDAPFELENGDIQPAPLILEGLVSIKPFDTPNPNVEVKYKFGDGGFEWNGESGGTTNNVVNNVEVSIENKPVISIPVDNRIYEVVKSVESPPIIQNNTNFGLGEINKMLLVDPDEPLDEEKNVINMLAKLRSNQSVIKKE